MHTRITASFTLITLLCATVAFAAPTKLSQQGRLLDGDGAPLTGTHGLLFSLHDAETAGNEVWQEERVVAFDEGYYSVVLGEQVPLSDLVFAAGSVWLELAVDGAVLSPRQEVVSVPYALRAAVAESVEGSTVDVDEVSIGGNVVIDGSGDWLGTPPDWSELTGVPADLSDGDADTLLGLPCADGFVAKYSAALGAWDCAQDNDSQLSEAQVESYINNGIIDLAAGSSMAGSTLATLDDLTTSTDWSTLTSIPANVAQLILDGDNNTDTLDGLVCLDGQIARWDDVLGLWICDADSVLSETDVEAFVSNAPIDLAAGTTIAGQALGGSVQSTGQVTLTSLQRATITPTATIPQFNWSAWLNRAGSWVPLDHLPMFEATGDGSDGAFQATGSSATLAGGVYNYTDFDVPAGTTLTITGSQPLVIRAQHTINIDGDVVAQGRNASGQNGGAASPGGAAGGNGTGTCSAINRHGSGGGAGSDGNCDAPASGGSRGIGAHKRRCGTNNARGGGGGGGGGLVILQGRHVQVSGLIDVTGGNGAVASNQSGGGGGGGTVYIEAAGIDLAASAFFALDGGQPGDPGYYPGLGYTGVGGDGQLIIKPRSSSFPASVTYLTNFEQCSADDGVPVEVSPYYDSSGLHVRNYGLNPADVVLNLSE